MKDKWYGDNRDLVKWGVLLQLAKMCGARRIVQVAYYRPETIEIDGKFYPMPSAVTGHFRKDLTDINRLMIEGVQIEVLDEPTKSFDAYTKIVLDRLEKLSACQEPPCILFLDPDNGLEPEKGTKRLEHVRSGDLKRIWEAIRGNDVLAFYQHKTDIFQHTDDNDWIEPKRKQFADALSLSRRTVKTARGSAANDVVFFYVQKSASERLKEESSGEESGKACPECGRQFNEGRGFGGIDGHWRKEHNSIMSYEEAWPLIKSGRYRRRGA